MTFDEAVKAGRISSEAALALFDSLPAVDLEFMRGTWKGSELPSGHPLDGLLATTGWYGKQFVDPESVHPLLFFTADGAAVFPVDPKKWPAPSLPGAVGQHRADVETDGFKARLRLTEFRGRLSATMLYDDRPVNDVFRKVDEHTVMGVMDARDMPQLYFFVLRRDPSAPKLSSR